MTFLTKISFLYISVKFGLFQFVLPTNNSHLILEKRSRRVIQFFSSNSKNPLNKSTIWFSDYCKLQVLRSFNRNSEKKVLDFESDGKHKHLKESSSEFFFHSCFNTAHSRKTCVALCFFASYIYSTVVSH